MNLYCCQFDMTWEAKETNFAKVRSLLRSSKVEPGSLVVLPEMFATGFSMNIEGIAEPEGGPTETFLQSLARELGVTLVAGVISRAPDGRRGRNQTVAFDARGTEVARYTKLQPFTMGGEMEYYEPGQAVVTFSWQGFTVAPYVCYDLRFPEVFRVGARRSATLMTVMASWPVKRIGHWVTLLQARAIENQCYVAGVNRVGTDPNLSYDGRSLIIDPSGNILAAAGDQESVIGADVDPQVVRSLREGLPFLKDMRDDYDRLA